MFNAHNLNDRERTEDIVAETTIDFEALLLSQNVIKGLHNSGFAQPSPIQLQAIPYAKIGLDLICQAKSGTGKTCVFAVCALEMVKVKHLAVQVLVLAPTREIAHQILGVIMTIGSATQGLKCCLFIGGIPVEQDLENLKLCHIAIGTPGRVKHLIEHGNLPTESIRLFVLDEADKLLEEGSFQEQINWIFSTLPKDKQVLALSATYPESLASHLSSYMQDPIHVRINVGDLTLKGVKQYMTKTMFLPIPVKAFEEKCERLVEIIRKVPFQQCMVFSNFQKGSENLSRSLCKKGWPCTFIAGSQIQTARLRAMNQLKNYNCRILITTDLTARGIDCDKVDLVINLDLPWETDTYLHRVGRAGRFGSLGVAISIVCEGDELKKLQSISEEIGKPIRVLNEDFTMDDIVDADIVEIEHVVDADVVEIEHVMESKSEIVETKTNGGGIVKKKMNGNISNDPLLANTNSNVNGHSPPTVINNGTETPLVNVNGNRHPTDKIVNISNEDCQRLNLNGNSRFIVKNNEVNGHFHNHTNGTNDEVEQSLSNMNIGTQPRSTINGINDGSEPSLVCSNDNGDCITDFDKTTKHLADGNPPETEPSNIHSNSSNVHNSFPKAEEKDCNGIASNISSKPVGSAKPLPKYLALSKKLKSNASKEKKSVKSQPTKEAAIQANGETKRRFNGEVQVDKTLKKAEDHSKDEICNVVDEKMEQGVIQSCADITTNCDNIVTISNLKEGDGRKTIFSQLVKQNVNEATLDSVQQNVNQIVEQNGNQVVEQNVNQVVEQNVNEPTCSDRSTSNLDKSTSFIPTVILKKKAISEKKPAFNFMSVNLHLLNLDCADNIPNGNTAPEQSCTTVNNNNDIVNEGRNKSFVKTPVKTTKEKTSKTTSKTTKEKREVIFRQRDAEKYPNDNDCVEDNVNFSDSSICSSLVHEFDAYCSVHESTEYDFPAQSAENEKIASSENIVHNEHLNAQCQGISCKPNTGYDNYLENYRKYQDHDSDSGSESDSGTDSESASYSNISTESGSSIYSDTSSESLSSTDSESSAVCSNWGHKRNNGRLSYGMEYTNSHQPCCCCGTCAGGRRKWNQELFNAYFYKAYCDHIQLVQNATYPCRYTKR